MTAAQRGEVWLVDLGLAARVRLCLVLSVPIQDGDRALLTLIAPTTSPRHSRFMVEGRAVPGVGAPTSPASWPLRPVRPMPTF